jgi:predicted nucleic acid-binding protein
MARYFLDSSALVKRYRPESGTAKIDSLFAEARHRLLISRLALVETQSAFTRLVREQILSQDEFAQLLRQVDDDVASGVVQIVGLSNRTLEDAAAILTTVGLKIPLRTLDAIHAASAQKLHQRSKLAAFVAADKRLLSSAEACGLPVLDVS